MEVSYISLLAMSKKPFNQSSIYKRCTQNMRRRCLYNMHMILDKKSKHTCFIIYSMLKGFLRLFPLSSTKKPQHQLSHNLLVKSIAHLRLFKTKPNSSYGFLDTERHMLDNLVNSAQI